MNSALRKFLTFIKTPTGKKALFQKLYTYLFL